MDPRQPHPAPENPEAETDNAAALLAAYRAKCLPNGDYLDGPMTIAYVCTGCQQIVRRLVVDWIYPVGRTICFGTMTMHCSVEGRREHPHRFDGLLDPDRKPEERSAMFEEVLCADCYRCAPARAQLEGNRQRYDAWWPAYQRVVELAEAGCAELARKVPARALEIADEFSAADLSEILDAAERAELASPHRTLRRREKLLRNLLHQRMERIEAFVYARIHPEALWDAAGLERAVQDAKDLAHRLEFVKTIRPSPPEETGIPLWLSRGSGEVVQLFRVVERPMLDAEGIMHLPSSARLRNPDELENWPDLHVLESVDPEWMLEAARQHVKPPFVSEAVQKIINRYMLLMSDIGK